MDVLGALIGTSGTLLLLIGLIMFLPLPSLQSKRWLAKRLAFGGLALFILGIVLTPTSPPAATGGEKESVAKAVDAQPVAFPPKSGPNQNNRAEFVAIFEKLIGAAKPCDAAVNKFVEVAQTGNVYLAYRAARDGSKACELTVETIDTFAIPKGLNSETAEKATEALATCRTAYEYRKTAFEKAMQFTDGDGRASVVNGFADDLQTAKAGIILCVGRFYEVAGKIGINPDRLAEVTK